MTTKTVKWNGKIHPLADLLPYLDGDLFDRLVDSIKRNGVREPIVLAPDGTLYDGRNRAKASSWPGSIRRSLSNTAIRPNWCGTPT